MELHDRIKTLRKKHLHLTQTEFGQRLGISRDAVGNLELNRLSRPGQKLSLIKLMCKEFNVNEDWLLHGKGEMFCKDEPFSFDRFIREHEIDDLERRIIEAYFKLDSDIRKKVLEHFREALQKDVNEDGSEEKTVEQLEEEYKKSRSGSASKTTVSASNSTGDREDPAAGE